MSFWKKRAETEKLWDELMAKQGSPAFAALGTEPEEICEQRIPNIRRYLDWYQNEYAQFMSLIDAAGLNSDVLLDYSDLDSDRVRTEKVLKSIYDIVPLYIQAAELFIHLNAIEQRRQYTTCCPIRRQTKELGRMYRNNFRYAREKD